MIKRLIKQRTAKKSSRGLYLQDSELNSTGFQPGTHFNYIVDRKSRKIIIVKTDEQTKNTVSRRQLKSGTKPVIDIRNKSSLDVFSEADLLQISIFDDEIIVEALSETKNEQNSSAVFSLQKKREQKQNQGNKISLFNRSYQKHPSAVFLSKKELAKAVGEQISFESFGWDLISDSVSDTSFIRNIPVVMQAASLFSGAGVMDEGFKQAGFDIVFALEKNEEAALTYQYNHGNHMIVGDITALDKSVIPKVPLIFGGSPCQGFSNSNRHTKFLDNPNNLLVKQFIESVKANEDCLVFVLENVPQILTAGEGAFKEEIYGELKDFEISSGVLRATDFGSAQDRKRAFFIGSKIGRIELPEPMFEPSSYRTVEDAFQGLNETILNQNDVTQPQAITVERMKHIPPDGNWKHLPDHLKTACMKKGKTHSSILKRLCWNKPSITISNPRKSLITHPSENRVLSIRECARLFDLPDSYRFFGSLSAKQQQVANSVPVLMAKAIAGKIREAFEKFNARNGFHSLKLI